jgi:hypothetical protein
MIFWVLVLKLERLVISYIITTVCLSVRLFVQVLILVSGPRQMDRIRF